MRNKPDEMSLFNALLNSSGKTRHASSFKVTIEDAYTLFRRTELFLETAENICKQKLAEYRN